MTYIIRRDIKTRCVRSFAALLCAFSLHGCGSVVKNPTRPKPTPAQFQGFATLLSSMIAEVSELLNAAEASVGTAKPKLGYECRETAVGAEVLFKGVSEYKVVLNGAAGGARNFTVEDSQKHTHNWSTQTDDVAKPSCAADSGLQQGVLDLGGLKLSYEFEQTTKITDESGALETTSSGQRDLAFTEVSSTDGTRKSYKLDVESQTSRSVTAVSHDLKMTESTAAFTYVINTGAWERKDFAGTIESSFENKPHAVRFEATTFVRGATARCFPSSGQVRGAMVTGDDMSFNFSIDFTGDAIPVLRFDGMDDETELKVLNCIY